MINAANRTYEILLGFKRETTTIRDTRDGLLKMLNARGLTAVKRGYTTWVVYENGVRCGSVQEIG